MMPSALAVDDLGRSYRADVALQIDASGIGTGKPM
jgi:hypothetical protein